MFLKEITSVYAGEEKYFLRFLGTSRGGFNACISVKGQFIQRIYNVHLGEEIVTDLWPC